MTTPVVQSSTRSLLNRELTYDDYNDYDLHDTENRSYDQYKDDLKEFTYPAEHGYVFLQNKTVFLKDMKLDYENNISNKHFISISKTNAEQIQVCFTNLDDSTIVIHSFGFKLEQYIKFTFDENLKWVYGKNWNYIQHPRDHNCIKYDMVFYTSIIPFINTKLTVNVDLITEDLEETTIRRKIVFDKYSSLKENNE